MAKPKTVYVCSECGADHPQWQGQCPDCGAWNTLGEFKVQSPSARSAKASGYAGATQSVPQPLKNISLEKSQRLATGFIELDRVLGGGLVAGSTILIGGDPGAGKSTLLLQVMAQLGAKVLYITGEESPQQVDMRAHRLGLGETGLDVLAETSLEAILTHLQKNQPDVAVIDSIQVVYSDALSSAPGSVSQVRESAAELVRFAKQTGTAVFMVGHVTKDGNLAGPKVLEHMIDCSLMLDTTTDSRFRLLRSQKNRFGAVDELGVFAMTDAGLKEVGNPSAIFLSRAEQPAAGTIVTAAWEGTRPLLVEIQALVDTSQLHNPRRVVVGMDHNRLAMLLAVLHRHAGIAAGDQDVFVNVVGGVRITETAADLPLVLSVLSSLRERAIPTDWISFGEIGLSGELRPVNNGQERLREAVKHGFKKAIVPWANRPKKSILGMDVTAVKTLAEAVEQL